MSEQKRQEYIKPNPKTLLEQVRHRLDRPDRAKIAEDVAQEFYAISMNDPSNNHLENKEWVLLVEARTTAKKIIALFPDVEEEVICPFCQKMFLIKAGLQKES